MAITVPIMGTYTHNLDGKNRFFIPAKHREALGSIFVIYPNIRDEHSLVVSSLEVFEEHMRKINENTVLTGEEKYEIIMFLNRNGDTLSPDAQGRVIISSSLVKMAGLSGPTVIAGCYSHAEIYPAQRFEDEENKTDISRLRQRYKEANL